MHRYVISYATGYVKIEPVKYILTGGKVKRKWWFGYREEWWIESDFMSYGPFNDYRQAYQTLLQFQKHA